MFAAPSKQVDHYFRPSVRVRDVGFATLLGSENGAPGNDNGAPGSVRYRQTAQGDPLSGFDGHICHLREVGVVLLPVLPLTG